MTSSAVMSFVREEVSGSVCRTETGPKHTQKPDSFMWSAITTKLEVKDFSLLYSCSLMRAADVDEASVHRSVRLPIQEISDRRLRTQTLEGNRSQSVGIMGNGTDPLEHIKLEEI